MSDAVITISRPSRDDLSLDLNSEADMDSETDTTAKFESQEDRLSTSNRKAVSSVVTPGELITNDPIWMKGHGVYFLDNMTYSAVAGNIARVNRLLSVIPLRGRYEPETGDHVVGRITEVGQKRWKVDIGAKQDAVLMLGSVNLPGGILRRKSENDELQMRTFLKEGDLLNAEVQTIFNNGLASLHTRSLKYGKLRNGVFLKVPSSLIIKQKNHSFDMPGSVSIVIGMNGFIWLSKTLQSGFSKTESGGGKLPLASTDSYTPGQGGVAITKLEEGSSWEIYSDRNDPSINETSRNTISRYYNVIKALAACELGITEPRIRMGYEGSMMYSDSGSLIEREAQESICQDILENERMRGSGDPHID
ncbi:Exosome complex component rrp4 [Candidozyma auris]|uniref:Uncharacterized protein n=2 Tax=Candidozyma auris TaxID=498019 RepID=A0A2H0ZHD5_CANAR|nr:exosome non-catalytic core subunit RRP4 [[Candida] auris]KND96818.2 hypothetical protein QG37_06935 [[Candida] auris]PIS49690.1 hypothetical protein B9J08_004716 [[Candida] auris]PIS50047.1 hypothetical protein CJI97_004735 [[Candida] auris]QEO23537.1 hypothetical_protein [[Candida] auris]QWW25183.1 hypothetical protein CA7LBN_004065 [[Candida] auris]